MQLPLPTLNEAYSTLIQEESQRGISGIISSSNQTWATSSETASFSSNGQRRSNVGGAVPRRFWICQHFHKKGHNKDQCWILHPTAEWYRREEAHTLTRTSKALKIQSSVPDKLWGDCILTACYIINILPYVVLKFKYQYERLHGAKPNMSHLRVFGCLCYGKNLLPKTKFDSRSRPSVFICYSHT